MHFSDPVVAPRFCVSFLLMAPVGEPVNRLSLRECFPVTCFGLFSQASYAIDWSMPDSFFFFFF